jgi:hypothetical protein
MRAAALIDELAVKIEKDQHGIYFSQTGSGDVVPKPLGTTHDDDDQKCQSRIGRGRSRCRSGECDSHDSIMIHMIEGNTIFVPF